MKKETVFVLIAAAGALGLWAWRMQGEQEAGGWSVLDDMQDMAQGALMKVGGVVGLETWRAPDQYRPAIVAAEEAQGIPSGLLEALLYTESRYREDIITGEKRSRVGALGIAQFMPATAADLKIDPLDPFQAIPAAAKYLRAMYRATGDWGMALAAYNWGLGNLQRKGIAAAPAETRNYFGQILAAVGGAGSALA